MRKLFIFSFLFLLVSNTLAFASNEDTWRIGEGSLERETNRVRSAYHQIAKARDQRRFPKRFLNDANPRIKEEAIKRFEKLPKER